MGDRFIARGLKQLFEELHLCFGHLSEPVAAQRCARHREAEELAAPFAETLNLLRGGGVAKELQVQIEIGPLLRTIERPAQRHLIEVVDKLLKPSSPRP
ncbi:MAG: hypothetical protein ACOY3P_13635 [Planctomycetota bacterium]